jgi:hypothetical protein
MKLILHHFRWLTYQLRWWIVAYCALWLAYGIGMWFIPPDSMVLKVLAIWRWVLPIVGGRIMLSAVWRDRVVGTDGFWRGRPLRAVGLWSAQWLLLLLLAVPPLISWLCNGLLLANTPEQWWLGLDDLGFMCLPLLIGATLGSFATGAYSVAVILGLAGACWVGGGLLFVKYDWVPWASLAQGTEYRQMASLRLGLILSSAVAVVAWARGVARGRRWVRGGMLGLALLLGPLAAAWLWLDSPIEKAQTLQGTVSLAGHYAPGSQRVRLAFEGFPAGQLPEVLRPELSLHTKNPTTTSLPSLAVFPNFRGGTYHDSQMPPEVIKEEFPLDTRWYLDASARLPKPWLVTFPEDSGPWTISGNVIGMLTTQTKLGRLRLELGSRVRNAGTMFHLHKYDEDETQLSVTVRVYRSISERSHRVNEIRQSVSNRPATERLTTVAYFPELHLALARAPMAWEELPQGLQVRSGQLTWQVDLPPAAVSQGIRFTPDTLRGAQLYFYETRVISDFRATADEVPIQVDLPSELELKVAKLAPVWNYASEQIIGDIIKAGNPGLRDLVAHRWSDVWFPMFAGRLLQNCPDDLLSEALAQDERWAQLAQREGLHERVATLLLRELTMEGRKLFLSELHMVLGKISPADYPAIIKQLQRQGPGLWSWVEKEPRTKLWRALRALPGFDWKSLARAQWQQIYIEDKVCQGVQILAALAGDASAFNALAESESLDESAGPEVAELASLVQDLPDGSERRIWLQQHWGHFTWDEALGKFRAKGP